MLRRDLQFQNTASLALALTPSSSQILTINAHIATAYLSNRKLHTPRLQRQLLGRRLTRDNS